MNNFNLRYLNAAQAGSFITLQGLAALVDYIL